ncbi:MAG TPA: MaoC family dehydratase [Pseudorhodoplanes sp.]|jgi:acyl dehydratase|nr:MaoC family dehydratase [Pseudorhodoplanes sp.]
MTFYEHVRVGECLRLGSHLFTADAIRSFAKSFDPQPFHLDEEAAKRSQFGALCASGWHTIAVWMRLMVEFQKREIQARHARGEPAATFGPSPGFRDVKWLKPVYAGDIITYETEITAKRVSASRPGFGLVTLFNWGANQHNERVMSFINTVFVPRLPR